MPKQTKKRVAAQHKARALGKSQVLNISNDVLYTYLDDNGLIWDHKQGAWVEGSTSIFTDGHGEPTGLVKIRVMGHPLDVTAWLKSQRRYQIIEVSDEYPNRKGPGVRVYTTWKEQ